MGVAREESDTGAEVRCVWVKPEAVTTDSMSLRRFSMSIREVGLKIFSILFQSEH